MESYYYRVHIFTSVVQDFCLVLVLSDAILTLLISFLFCTKNGRNFGCN